MLPYSPDLDRLLHEARMLAKQLDTAEPVPGAISPHQRASAAVALLDLRIRLSHVLAGIADGQAGASRDWAPTPAVVGAEPCALEPALASLEQRLADVRRSQHAGLPEGGLAPY